MFMESTRYFCQIIIKSKFSKQIFEKFSISNFMKIRPVGTEYGQTDRHEKAKNRFSQF